MNKRKILLAQQAQIPDDQRLVVIKRDLSSGINTRVHPSQIPEKMAETLENVDIGTPGQRKKRPGSVLIGNDVGSDTPQALHNFEVQGETPQLVMYEDTHAWKWTGTGNWAALKTDFTTGSTDVGIISAKESGLTPDDVIIVQNGIDNAFRIDSDGNAQDLGATTGTGSDSPPKSTVMAWYNNRIWVLKDDLLYWSAAYSADYSTAFDDVADWFRIPVGDERGIAVTRDTGLVIMGDNAIWGLAPSNTPVNTDQPQPLVSSVGVVSKKGWCVVADDIYFFAQDGLRSLKRTQQDKLQMGASYPLSYALKTEFDAIDWGYIDQLSMVYFDNKLFISVPTGASTYDTWVYYPAMNAFMTIDGWSPRCWAKYKVSGEENLYYGKQGDGTVYQAWNGYTDEGTTTSNGTTVTMTEVAREEDFGQPLTYKNGGVLELEANAAGNYDIDVYAAINGGSFTLLGSLTLSGSSAPVLPIALPFTLSDTLVLRENFHLEELGRFRTLQIKLINEDAATDDIIVYNYNITTFGEEYEDEQT